MQKPLSQIQRSTLSRSQHTLNPHSIGGFGLNREQSMATTNLPIDEWTEVFGSERLTEALLGRLAHHVHILEMNGESYRLMHSRDTVAS